MKQELADVLFIEIIGYAALPMDEGVALHEILTRMVEDTKTFRSARQPAELIACPTVEGMALAFFGNPLAPVRCAMSESNLRDRHFKPLMRKAEIPLQKGDGPYLLRHTVVTQLLLAGEPPQAVAERVGDTVTTIMQHYAHAVPGLQDRATETVAALVFGDS